MKQQLLSSIKLYPLGDAAIVLHFGDSIAPAVQDRVSACAAYLEQHFFPGLIEYVPAFTTLTIYYNPWLISEKGMYNPYDQVVSYVQQMLLQVEDNHGQPSRIMEIPVLYGGEFGPDLEFVCSYTGLSPEEVISIHAGSKYRVYMIGFAPGFPYLGGMNEKIATPRKESPRIAIPKGSVGIAGKQTGIYPIETPGGWQLIGRTPLALFNPHWQSPALFKAGDTIRFKPITPTEYQDIKQGLNES